MCGTGSEQVAVGEAGHTQFIPVISQNFKNYWQGSGGSQALDGAGSW